MNVMPNAVSQEAGSAGLCSRPALGETTVGGTTQPVTWQLPEETPVALQINSEPYTVMMATPADLRDFAIGFLIGEGIVKNARDIQGVLVMPVESGMAVDVAVPKTSLETSRLARRAIEGRTGCGLCGVEDIASALRPLPILARSWSPATGVIQRAAGGLFQHQPMNRLNRSVHGAAWVSQDGQILLVREDVGRHNALDKLIGALLLKEQNLQDGFVLMTSRCSFELVQKTVTAGIGALVTVSAPTALALDLARKSNLFLAALGPGGPVVFNS
jgi:FdhD protein